MFQNGVRLGICGAAVRLFEKIDSTGPKDMDLSLGQVEKDLQEAKRIVYIFVNIEIEVSRRLTAFVLCRCALGEPLVSYYAATVHNGRGSGLAPPKNTMEDSH